MAGTDASEETGVQLTESSVIGYLIDKGVITDDDARVEPLSGGVSADVFAVRTRAGSWVVKQLLPQLKVDLEWNASPARAITEAAALDVTARIIPGSVPPLVFVDEVEMVVVTERAPDHLREWKSELMGGGRDHSVDTAAKLGEILARLHSCTFHDSSLKAQFGDIEPFVALRTDPFHHTVAGKYPELSARLGQLAEELVTTPTCLVHGDFSPKNVLSSGSEVWVLDWEVAHLGLPTFDVAFLLAHLICKTIHSPRFHRRYRECAESFVASYQRGVRVELRLDGPKVVGHTAAIVLARADGKSPAGYLTAAQRDTVRDVATQWIAKASSPSDFVDYLWSALP